MGEIHARSKVIEYDTLTATIYYREHVMTLTNKTTDETITIPGEAYAELQAILSDIGRQVPQPTSPRR